MNGPAMQTSARVDESGRYHELPISAAVSEDSNSKDELDRRLDQALEHTFPASDPVSIVISVAQL